LSKKASGQWGFDGKEINVENMDSFSLINLRKMIIAVLFMEKLIRYIASDGEAVSIIHDDQGCAKSPEDVVADVTKLLDPNRVFMVRFGLNSKNQLNRITVFL